MSKCKKNSKPFTGHMVGLTAHIPTQRGGEGPYIQADADDHAIVQLICEVLEPITGGLVRGPKNRR